MVRRRTVTTLTEAERQEFIRAAVAFHASCIKPMSSMRTDAEAYPVLRDMALAVSEALGKSRATGHRGIRDGNPEMTERAATWLGRILIGVVIPSGLASVVGHGLIAFGVLR